MDTTREYVSMLMDGDQVSEEMLDRLLSDDAAAEAWYEYHLLGDCMRYKEGTGRDADFMQSAEISEEHKQRHEAEVAAVMPVVKEVQAANSSFFKSFAVAASVAAVAVAVWQFGPQVKGDSSGMVAEKAVETKNQQENIVPVAANPTAKNASDAVVMPESAKNDKGVSQTTVRTETQVQQDSVVH